MFIKKPFVLHAISAEFFLKFLDNKKTCKNRHIHTFGIPKSNWWCLRTHHALCWKALDPSYPAKTYLMVIRCVERTIFTILWKMHFSKISKIFNFLFKVFQNGFFKALKSKNRYLRMFMFIKIVSRIVRPPRLFLRIPTDPNKSSKANFEF